MTDTPPDPRMFALLDQRFVILQCAIDGNIWDRNQSMTPPCQHSDQEWADWAAANGKPANSADAPLAHWLYYGPAPSKAPPAKEPS